MLTALQALLAAAIDYAGMFPPARLPLESAAACYARYRSEPSRSLLGVFVVPIDRVDDLAAARRGLAGDGDHGAWPVSVLVTDADDGTAGRLHQLRDRHRDQLRLDAVEVAPIAAGAIAPFVHALESGWTVSFELALDPGLEERLLAVVAAGAQAKVRTGGVTVEAIPSPSQVAVFLALCHRIGAPFKATAGLHHPLRGLRSLTYDVESLRAEMHGFLNLLVAAVLLYDGKLTAEEAAAVLAERDFEMFRFAANEIGWRDYAVSVPAIEQARSGFLRSFGSCSFEEPLQELRELGLS